MTGRIENEIKINNNIHTLLKTMPKYASDFYYNMQSSKSKKTCLEYLRQVNHFLKYIDMDIKDVDDVVIGKYFESIRLRNGKKYSESYTKFAHTILSQFFRYLYEKKIIDTNPMKLIKRSTKRDEVKRYYLTMDDLNKILESSICEEKDDSEMKYKSRWKSRNYAMLFLLMTTGMRRTALSEMNVENVDFENKQINVVDKRDKVQVYDMTEEMETVLLKWLQERKKILKGKKTDALFIIDGGYRMTSNGIYRVVKKYSEKALGYAISPHKLRAAFVSLYYEACGHDIEATRIAVGHESISTTSIYINKKNDARSNAVNFMSAGLKQV